MLRDRCLSYLALVSRLRGDVAETRLRAQRSLESAETLGTLDYVGAARAQLGWSDWRDGGEESALRSFRAALDAWTRFAARAYESPFQWMVRWPLVAIELRRGDVASAAEQARVMLAPLQQYQGEAIEAHLRAAVSELHDPGRASSSLREALTIAEATGWL